VVQLSFLHLEQNVLEPHFDNFIASSSNQEAFHFISSWPHWHGMGCVLYGPKGSGKSHLLEVWQKKTNALQLQCGDISAKDPHELLKGANLVFIDDFDPIALCATGQRHLFHIYNILAERRGHILITSKTPPSSWDIPLPDLLSRMRSLTSIALTDPDDDLRRFMFATLFHERQIRIPTKIIDFLLTSTEKSLHSIQTTVQMIDEYALLLKRNVTLQLVKEALKFGPSWNLKKQAPFIRPAE
jgi:DnaA regulatory inactivator Hda